MLLTVDVIGFNSTMVRLKANLAFTKRPSVEVSIPQWFD